MAYFQNDHVEFDDEYLDITDFEDHPFEEIPQQQQHQQPGPDSDVDEDYDMNKAQTDTSATEARNGKDIQGIPWERLNFTRDRYRQTRLKQYKAYQNFPRHPYGEIDKECKQVEKGCNFYDFQFNTRLVKSTIVHFQLRNLLWATSKHDAYLMQNYSVMHWSSLKRRSKEVFNAVGTILPTLEHTGSLGRPLSRVQISTMAVKDNLMVVGGFRGELICKYLDCPGVSFCTKIGNNDDNITNSVDIYYSNGSTRLMTANNDANVRVFDTQNFACVSQFPFSWSVNNTSVSPDGKLLAVVGDNVDCLIADVQSGKVAESLKGHSDYSFASAWHPDGRILATGNQDTTCRLWDVRNLSQSLSVLKGRMGAIRSIKFTSDGRFMAMAEPADFVHIYDTQSGYSRGQDIDLFGDIGGISFSPDTEALFVAVADRTYGSLLEFDRRRFNQYLDSVI